MTTTGTPNLEFGTCSWNYDSWVGLVYDKMADYSAAYLSQYAKKYRTVEVDSWFYKVPDPSDAAEYKSRVPPEFTFACKLTESIALTHKRSRDKSVPIVPNPGFLSVEEYGQFVSNIDELIPQIFLLELEFEYLNKQKMADITAFMKAVETFVTELETHGLKDKVPLAIECRNANYLKREYFQFLKDHDITHVFSEKLYLPHVYELYSQVSDLIGNRVALRLLGGDRKEIETKPKGNWNKIVDAKSDLPEVASMIGALANGSRIVKVYLKNHYEGWPPRVSNDLKRYWFNVPVNSHPFNPVLIQLGP